jgi:hypothetical protein
MRTCERGGLANADKGRPRDPYRGRATIQITITEDAEGLGNVTLESAKRYNSNTSPLQVEYP